MDLPTIDLDGPIVYACVLSTAVGWFIGFLSDVCSLMGAEARRRDAEDTTS